MTAPPDDGWADAVPEDEAGPPSVRKQRSPKIVTLPGVLNCTDMGNAERLVALHRESIRYCTPRKKWLIWDGRRYGWDDRQSVMGLAKQVARSIYAEAGACGDKNKAWELAKHAHDSEASGSLTALLKLAQSEPGVPVLPDELDHDPWLFNCANGTLDLRTSKLRPHDQADRITKLSPVVFDVDAKSETWDRFITELCGDHADLQPYLQRSVGYWMFGAWREKAFWFLYGPPNGRKSTFLHAVAAAFGDYAHFADFQTWLVQSGVGGNRDDLVALLGARLVISIETRKDARFDTALLKRVTGGDPITASAKYESTVTFAPSFALVLAANDRPHVHSDDEGLYDRLRCVPCTSVLAESERIHDMGEQLRAPDVQAAILAWAVRGLTIWRDAGLGVCEPVQSANRDYRHAMDKVSDFLAERCEFTDARVAMSTFRKAYQDHCSEVGIKRPASGKDIARALEQRGCQPVKSMGIRFWSGVRLLEEGESQEEGQKQTPENPVKGNGASDPLEIGPDKAHERGVGNSCPNALSCPASGPGEFWVETDTNPTLEPGESEKLPWVD